MRKIFTPSLFVVVLIASTTVVKSQNKVPNPGFEVQDSCPKVSQLFLAKPWFTPTYGSPDLFNTTCPSQAHPSHTGIGCSGVFVYSGDLGWENNREYMEAPLISPLLAGKSYYVSFWVQTANFKYAVNKMGAWFSNTLFKDTLTSRNLPYMPQVENATNRPLTSSSWMQISGSFVAAGGEAYIIIGNLAPDAQTTTYIYNSASPYNDAYLYVDDIVVTQTNVGIDEAELAASFHVFPNPATDLVTINFSPSISVQSVKLINATGEVVMNSEPAEHVEGEYRVDTQKLPGGVYYLTILSDERVVNKKLMIIH